MANCRTVLSARPGPTRPGAAAGARARREALGSCLARLEATEAVDAVRGLEGEAAAAYFGAFDHLLTQQKEAFFFKERSRRPPLDRINALLSFVYTLLAHDVAAACQAVGLDPQVGFLHRDRPGRPGLALDLMEELRPVVADRLVLSLVNRRQLEARDFSRGGSGAVTMRDEARRR